MRIAIALILLCYGPLALADDCAQRKEFEAETAVEHLDTWQKLADAHQKFRSCDDGAIAEGFSEAVARLLADQWGNLAALVVLIHSQPTLKDFVVKHLD